MIRFIQFACYASTVNKANFRIIREQSVIRFIFDLPKHVDLRLMPKSIFNEGGSMSGTHYRIAAHGVQYHAF